MATARSTSIPPRTIATAGRTGLVPTLCDPCTTTSPGGSSCVDAYGDGDGPPEEKEGSFVVVDPRAARVTGGGAIRGVEPSTLGTESVGLRFGSGTPVPVLAVEAPDTVVVGYGFVVVTAPEGTVVGANGGGSGWGEEVDVVVGGIVVVVVVVVGGTVVVVVVGDRAAEAETGSMTAPNRAKREPATAFRHFTPLEYQPANTPTTPAVPDNSQVVQAIAFGEDQSLPLNVNSLPPLSTATQK